MDKTEFSHFRKKLSKTQREIAQLLGTSLKAVHSYEQGWRTVPTHVERQVYFLISRKNRAKNGHAICWEVRNCTEEQREQCPAWEFQTGELCWFINGTICEGQPHPTWKEKMKNCRSCEVLKSQL